MKTSLTPIIPVEQSVVTIAGHEIPVVRLPNGDVGAPLRTFCDMLGLHYSTQVQKVQTHPAIYDKLVLVLLKTNGGPQEANVIIAEAIPIWLTSMHISRVAPQSRELLRICQRDAARTIRSKFFPDTQGQQSAPPKSPPPPPPLPQQDTAALSAPELLRLLASWLEQDQRQQAAQRAETQRRLLAQREELALVWAAIRRLNATPDAQLADEHEQMLHMLLHCAGRITGQPMEELEREALAVAGVAEVWQMRGEAWSKMIAWLLQRIDEG